MLSSRTAFLVVSVLFQVAKCSLGKLWLCIIEIQRELLAIFHQFELFDCVFGTRHSHSSVSSSLLAAFSLPISVFSKMRLKDSEWYYYKHRWTEYDEN